MKSYQQTFIELCIEHQVLSFGEYKLKSGRLSPYFFNMGKFSSGSALKIIGECYAAALTQSSLSVDCLFGPAYKGIPLVCTTAIALATQYQKDLPYAFNRKEDKDHGEGGSIIGAPLNGRILILDDVITAGTAIRESIELIHKLRGTVAGIMVALDRQEKGDTTLSALKEIQQRYNIPVTALICLEDIMEFVTHHSQFHVYSASLEAYRKQYGA